MADPNSVAALQRLLDEIIQLIVENDNLEEIELRIDEATSIYERIKHELDELTANQMGSVLIEMKREAQNSRNTQSEPGFSAERPRTGQKGRPKVEIPEHQINTLVDMNYTAPQMASHFKCSLRTIHNRLNSLNIRLRECYSQMTDADLDVVIVDLHQTYPNAGYVVSRG